MCNLYSITTNQAAIAALFRVMNRKTGPRSASGLWLPDDGAECRGRAVPSEGYAGDPDDRRGTRRMDARAPGTRRRRCNGHYRMT
jgi:hypothetical protein